MEIINQKKIDIEYLKKDIEKRIKEKSNISESVKGPDMLLNEHANNILRLAVLEARLQHAQNS